MSERPPSGSDSTMAVQPTGALGPSRARVNSDPDALEATALGGPSMSPSAIEATMQASGLTGASASPRLPDAVDVRGDTRLSISGETPPSSRPSA